MDSELEKEFAALLKTVGKEIHNKVTAAANLLNEAEELANRHGIPFYSEISPLGQKYIPRSFRERFSTVDLESLSDIAHMELDNYFGNGWEQSALC